MSTTPGEIKNIVDSLRRALQGPASTLASGSLNVGNTFTLTLTPTNVNDPGGVAWTQQFQVTLTPAPGFSDSITCVDVNNFCGGATTGFQFNPVAILGTTAGVNVYTVNLPANCPAGSYTCTVTGTGALTGATSSAVLTVTVAANLLVGCSKNSDCQSGCTCLNGTCSCIIDNTPIGCGSTVATGVGANPCNTSRNVSLCAGESQGAPFTDTSSGQNCCYCGPSNCNQCAQYTPQCQIKNGPCSVSQCQTTAAGTGCYCTECTGSVNVSVACPGNLNVLSGALNSVYMPITNSGTGQANVSLSVTYSGGGVAPSCIVGGGPVLQASSLSLAQYNTASVGISAVNSCSTAKCYSYMVKAVVTNIAGQTLQTLTCPVSVCSQTSGLLIQVNGGSGWGSSASGTSGPWQASCLGCTGWSGSGNCLAVAAGSSFSWQAVSIGGGSGTIPLSCSQGSASDCNGTNYGNCGAIPSSTGVGIFAAGVSVAVPFYGWRFCGNIGNASNSMTVCGPNSCATATSNITYNTC